MNKKFIRLTEQDLHRVVKESVKRILSEMDVDQIQEPKYKEGDIVYWMYCYSGTFPSFYKVIKVGPRSIWVSRMGSKHSNVTMGYGSYDAVPDESNVSDKVKRISLRPNGMAYITYYGHKQVLNVWTGKPISCMSD